MRVGEVSILLSRARYAGSVTVHADDDTGQEEPREWMEGGGHRGSAHGQHSVPIVVAISSSLVTAAKNPNGAKTPTRHWVTLCCCRAAS